ncbi:hypothetical protein B0T10DRAFT_5121 [Thelonectria olida]|uniref:Uncharacterized protein n=1 Tax=Thelonectria olida TaxID=1576542 RepID=A0A9P8WJU7_9HYPO|nr:hypothetical protein B0T10DRAFT_5121 [Thelonectria olida]
MPPILRQRGSSSSSSHHFPHSVAPMHAWASPMQPALISKQGPEEKHSHAPTLSTAHPPSASVVIGRALASGRSTSCGTRPSCFLRQLKSKPGSRPQDIGIADVPGKNATTLGVVFCLAFLLLLLFYYYVLFSLPTDCFPSFDLFLSSSIRSPCCCSKTSLVACVLLAEAVFLSIRKSLSFIHSLIYPFMPFPHS